jgi:hypothetical protein
MDEVVLPHALAGVEVVEPTTAVVEAFADAEDDVAAGRTLSFDSDEEFEAYLDALAEHPHVC